jgi:RND family efflux transporter MFP subunit
MTFNRIWIGGALLLSTLSLTGCGLLPPEAEQPPVAVVAPQVTQREIFTVKRGSIAQKVSLNLSFGADRQASLYFKGGGRLKKLYAAPGQQVAAGALLAELEPGSLPYDLSMAEIDLEKARLSLEKARGRAGFVDAPSAADLKRLELDLAQAELRLQRQQGLLADTRLYAPFAGQVVSAGAAENDMVDAYKEVLLLAGEGAGLARAPVDDATAARLQVGQAAELFPADGDPSPVLAHVASVPAVGSAAREKVALIAPDKASPRIRPGRNGKADVVVQSRENALLVPLSAIRSYGGRQFVTVVREGARQEVAVVTGIESDKYAEVLEGLNEGDQVVSR